MEYTRKTTTDLTPLKSIEVTLLWGNDGWCYIPELSVRQKFTETTYFSEKWTGILPLPLHIEEVLWTIYSESPLVWGQKSQQLEEIFETKKKDNNKLHTHLLNYYQQSTQFFQRQELAN